MDQSETAAGALMLSGYTATCHPWRNGNYAHAQCDEVAGRGKQWWPQHQ